MTKTERELLIAQRELLREYKGLINLCNSKEFFNIPSVNLLESKIAELEAKIIVEENR